MSTFGVDNAVLRQKIQVRNEFFNRFSRVPLAVDFFAGEGTIAQSMWAQVAERVECVDLDAEKLACITTPNITTHAGDNSKYLHLADGASVIDCDAYGLVLPFIKALLERQERHQTLFFVTDGTPKVARRQPRKASRVPAARDFRSQILGLKPTEFHFEKGQQSNVFYGWLWFE